MNSLDSPQLVRADLRGWYRADLRGWYAEELKPKVTRAVAQGRVDPSRACELHRLMADLLEASLPPIGAEGPR